MTTGGIRKISVEGRRGEGGRRSKTRRGRG